MPNEGQLFKGTFGGDIAYTTDHPVIIRNGVLAATANISAGCVLTRNEDGTLSAYAGSGAIAGVAAFGANATDATISYVAHGTVKVQLLANTDGTPFTNYAALHSINIYEV